MNTQICQIHNAEMKKRTNANGSWYSHQLGDKTWCNGYEKKPVELTKKFTQLPNGSVVETDEEWPVEAPTRPLNAPTSEVEPKSDIRAVLKEINDKLDYLVARVPK